MANTGTLRITSAGLGSYFGLTGKHLDAIAALGFQLYEQGKAKDAETIFKGILALDDKCYFGYAGLGAIALANEPPHLEAACSNLQRASELRPDDPVVHANLGEALLRSARFDDAAREFAECFRLDPEQRNAGTSRARAIIGGMEAIVAEVRKMKAGTT